MLPMPSEEQRKTIRRRFENAPRNLLARKEEAIELTNSITNIRDDH
jgi:hypothetical protein